MNARIPKPVIKLVERCLEAGYTVNWQAGRRLLVAADPAKGVAVRIHGDRLAAHKAAETCASIGRLIQSRWQQAQAERSQAAAAIASNLVDTPQAARTAAATDMEVHL